ncbi:ABC transporter substrate-binding protein [Clostridium estertheticum]|uniref:ABC transporter substrate-binding protein n=1 Tax=Clostridium estertheticum TaxID=238834 RepID=UPI001CF5878A|nr:ABC transporter substrate-binding protein [Clostridium estertheticum]MCB2306867.1 ABC transporter substrate-binding protein [Clostridium estertheticum]MCB2345344.1 ABC transporter substrate-binding protein [Clostridium estertheticum]MCB2350373.1 ABC transporter substrate-binding protein [Clostridium estertheticum]WAG45229.1 ABC transporter substrate-binding protein [Clostridium estertheticum]
MFKKKMSLLLSMAMAIGLLAGCGAKSASTTGDIKIGVVLPLTGPNSSFGKSGQNGIKLLEDQLNKDGGINGRKIKFIYEDDEGKPDTATTVGTKLISSDNVVAIVGPLTSGSAIALGPIATQSKIPMITGSGTNPDVTKKGGEYVYRSCFIDPFQGTVIAKFASGDLKAKTAAILYDNGNDYSKGLAEFFEKSFVAAGGKIVAKETYATGDKDFKAQLTKMQPTKPDVVLLPDYYGTVGNIAKQARAIGITVPLLGGDGWDSAELFKVGGTAVNGCYLSDHYSAADTAPIVVAFQKEYKAKYNLNADAMAVLNYDAAKIMVEAIKTAGKTDGPSIKAALAKTNLEVVSGKVSFNENRDAIKGAVILKVDGGKFNFVKKLVP